jgi:hypothetical protein
LKPLTANQKARFSLLEIQNRNYGKQYLLPALVGIQLPGRVEALGPLRRTRASPVTSGPSDHCLCAFQGLTHVMAIEKRVGVRVRALPIIVTILLRLSSSYHPQSDGQTEGLNQTMETFLRCFCNACPSKWSDWLPLAEYWYNSCHHSAVGFSLFEALYGYSPKHFVWRPVMLLQALSSTPASRTVK